MLRNVSWKGYQTLLSEIGDSAARFTFYNGLLEIEAPSKRHEQLKKLAAALVEATLDSRATDYEPLGSTTWSREERLKGVEPDECYYIANAGSVRGKSEIDLAIDPPPDLVIEVEVSLSAIDKLSVYAALGIPEVWRIRGDGSLQMLRLSASGEYETVARSGAVAGLAAEVLESHLRLLAPAGPLGHAEIVRRFKEQLRR